MSAFLRLTGLVGWVVTVAVALALLGASWAQWGDTVAFQRTGQEGQADIYVVDVFTHLTVNLTRNPYNDRFPSWSPDGEELVIQAFRPLVAGVETLYRMPFRVDMDVRLLLPQVGVGIQPSWSPDGCCVAYSAYDNATYSNNIHIMRLADEHVWNAAPIPGLSQFSPAWSPDGEQIAVAGGAVDGYLSQRIVTFAVDTEAGTASGPPNVSQALPVTRPDGYITPAWMTDSASLVFARVSLSQEPGRLYRASLPVPELFDRVPFVTMLVEAAPRATYPDVSPDGEWIVYSGADSRDMNSTVLYISRSDGTDLQQLTFREGATVQDTAPAWRPVRRTR